MDVKKRDLKREYGDTKAWPNDVNVHKVERMASTALGLGLAVFGAFRRGFVGAGMAVIGGALVHRGVTGHCSLYSALRVSTAHDTRGPSASVPHMQGVKVKHTLTVRQPPEQVYGFWRQLENLPRFMRHIESVTVLDAKRSHWRAKGPAGSTLEWDAEIINEIPGELLAWRSLPGSQVPNAGSVRFARAAGGHGTVITVTLEYAPPAGVLGTLVAKLLGADPDRQVEEDLQRLKDLLEAGEVPRIGAEWRGRLSELENVEAARQSLKTDPGRGLN